MDCDECERCGETWDVDNLWNVNDDWVCDDCLKSDDRDKLLEHGYDEELVDGLLEDKE